MSLYRVDSRWTWCKNLPVNGQIAIGLPRKWGHCLQMSLYRVDSRWTWWKNLPVNGQIAIGPESQCFRWTSCTRMHCSRWSVHLPAPWEHPPCLAGRSRRARCIPMRPQALSTWPLNNIALLCQDPLSLRSCTPLCKVLPAWCRINVRLFLELCSWNIAFFCQNYYDEYFSNHKN